MPSMHRRALIVASFECLRHGHDLRLSVDSDMHTLYYLGSSIVLTCAATTRQPSGKRTHVCCWRPTLPGAPARYTRVEATAKSRPKVVMTVFDSVRGPGP